MKKRWLIGAVIAILLLGLAAAVFLFFKGRRPYQNLDAADISSASVLLTPPDKRVAIRDISTLVEYLKDVVIYQEDPSYTEYAGQSVVFTLTKNDGTQTEIAAYNPFLIIDGVGYRTKYEPCEALNQYANKLLNEGDAVTILEGPPALSVVSNNTSENALLGTYSWEVHNPDGTVTGGEADSPHPLDLEDLLSPPLETPETTATLRFAEEPDEILQAACWSAEHFGDPAALSGTAEVRGDVLTLRPGGHIYEITARWDSEDGWGGMASYVIYIKANE